MNSKHNRQQRGDRGDKNQSFVRDDEYDGGDVYKNAGYAYDRTAADAGVASGSACASGNLNAGTRAMPDGRAQPASGSGVAPDSRNHNQSRGALGLNSSSTMHNSTSNNINNNNMNAHGPPSLASIRDSIQRRRCQDETCGKPVAWRNAEDVFVGSRGPEGVVNLNTDTSLNASGSLGPIYANQDDRDYLVKLMSILSVTGLPLPDLASATGFASGVLPSLDTTAGEELPQTRAWECARYAVERDRREFFFHNRAPTQNVIFSSWCPIHTCRYFFSRERCASKKIPFDMVCNTHTICPVGCATAKTQMIDHQQSNQHTIAWLRDDFCQKHGCAADGCSLRCDQADGQTDLRFCPSHRCYYRGCTKQGQAGRGYCYEHKCQNHSCDKLSLAGFALCRKHIECAQNKCLKPRHVIDVANVPIHKDRADYGIEYYDRRAYLLYCSDHAFCGASPSCRLLRKTPAIHCFKHVCSETGCGIAASEDVPFCSDHRCGQPTCSQPKAWKSDRKNRENFCLGHLCCAHDCDDGVGDDHLYCVIHECDTDSCTSKNTGGGFCVNHAQASSQKKGESAAHARTARLARVLQSARAAPDYLPGYYPSRPLVPPYGADSPATSRSSHRTHHRNHYPSTPTRSRKRNSGPLHAGSTHIDDSGSDSYDDDEEDTGDSAGESVHSRQHGGSREAHRRADPVPGPAVGASASASVRPQASQQQPSGVPGGPNGGVRPMPARGARPMGRVNGPSQGGPGGPGQNEVQGEQPPNKGNYRADT